MNLEATKAIRSLQRISKIESARNYDNDVLFYPKHADIEVTTDNMIKTIGLNNKLDKKEKDLLRVIQIINATELEYTKTNVLIPRTFAESLEDIPYHISVQGLLFTKATTILLEWIKNYNALSNYGTTHYDKFWLPFCPDLSTIDEGSFLYLMNRRVGGWDGSIDRPVIELLGAGGHLPSCWNTSVSSFEEPSFSENFQREIQEELGFTISQQDITILGGFNNEKSHELVVLCAIYIDSSIIENLQSYSKGNINENIDGLYIGEFWSTIDYYNKHPEYFAGGKEACPYNFPSQRGLMERVQKSII